MYGVGLYECGCGGIDACRPHISIAACDRYGFTKKTLLDLVKEEKEEYYDYQGS